jgi:NADH:ubiquinone oxidoreductase subunit E
LTETAKSPPELEALGAELKPDNADLLAAFHRIQEAYGYVPPQAIPLLAAKLRTTPAMVFGAMSFYSEIRTEPPPRVSISWCSGPACRLKGAENIAEHWSPSGVELARARPTAVGLSLVQCDGTCQAPLRLNGHRALTVAEPSAARELRGTRGTPLT